MFKLLRCTCLHCFALKMEAEELGRYRRRLALLAEGRLIEAALEETAIGALAKNVRPQTVICMFKHSFACCESHQTVFEQRLIDI